MALPVPNVDEEREDELEDDTDEDENDDSSPPINGSESRLGWLPTVVGSLLMLRPTGFMGIVLVGLEGFDTFPFKPIAADRRCCCWASDCDNRLNISHLLLLPLTLLLVLGLF